MAIRTWTGKLQEIERRLLADITPFAFEHLCVDLLQLEHRDQTWTHVGGSGDRGVDGIGSDANGSVTSVLQCKWAYWGDRLEEFAAPRHAELGTGYRRILTSLMHPEDGAPPSGIEFSSRAHIAGLVLKHAASLPAAVSMRITSTQASAQ